MCFKPPPPTPSPSSSPPSHGLRELLAIWMLALYCEHSLIASVLPTVSQASQHGGPAVCLICHCSVVIHCKKKKTVKRMIDRGKEREREGERAFTKRWPMLPQVCSLVVCFLPLSSSAPCSSHSQRQSMVYSTRLLLVLS